MKRIIPNPSVKDGNGMFQAVPKEPEIPASDISIDRLMEDSLLVLYREIKNLKRMSVSGKLEASDARDLRDNLKLLFELKERENTALRGLTDEQLESQAKAFLNDQDQNSNPKRDDIP